METGLYFYQLFLRFRFRERENVFLVSWINTAKRIEIMSSFCQTEIRRTDDKCDQQTNCDQKCDQKCDQHCDQNCVHADELWSRDEQMVSDNKCSNASSIRSSRGLFPEIGHKSNRSLEPRITTLINGGPFPSQWRAF